MVGDDMLRSQTRGALRRLAKSVVIITCGYEGQRLAMTATAADALSMDPPSMMVAVNRNASIHKALSSGVGFCVNILGVEHQAIAENCYGSIKGEKRFSLGQWSMTEGAIPMLVGAQANIVCKHDGEFEYGSHSVFIGKVTRVLEAGGVDPLVYVDGVFAASIMNRKQTASSPGR